MKKILVIETSDDRAEITKMYLQKLYGSDFYVEGITSLEMGWRRDEIYKDEERFDLFFVSGEFLLKGIEPDKLIKLIGKEESKIIALSMFSDTLDKLRDKVSIVYSRDEFDTSLHAILPLKIKEEILNLI